MKQVTKYITRKSLIYKTEVEYGDYTLNHVLGCAHGCMYPCYAMLMSKRFGICKTYKEWTTPAIVSNALELLDKEIPIYKNKIHSLHLCFTTDPFMYGYSDICSLSFQILKKCNEAGIDCSVLTKGTLPIKLANLSKDNWYGITLISLSESFRKKMEPGSAPYKSRIQHLKALHDAECNTWVSIEPYPTPNICEQNFSEILNAVSFVDKIIFGRLNYNKEVTAYKNYKQYFNELAQQVIDYCELH